MRSACCNAAATRLGAARDLASLRADFFEDVDDRPEDEIEAAEERLVDSATAAQTISELQAEIATLTNLEQRAKALRHAGTDTKWRELQTILDHPLMTDAAGNRRKLIIFTEPRDTSPTSPPDPPHHAHVGARAAQFPPTSRHDRQPRAGLLSNRSARRGSPPSHVDARP